MSCSNKAVFLSYGSQDAEEARFARTLNVERSTLNVQVTTAGPILVANRSRLKDDPRFEETLKSAKPL
jgi:hypothetical protein